MDGILAELLIILLLILANGVFAGAEIALVSVRRTRIDQLVEEGRGSAFAVKALRDEPERFLATVQIGITVVSASAAAFGGASLAADLEPTIARVSWLAPAAPQISLGLVIAAVSYLSIVLGELVPKSLALRSSEAYALLIGRPLRALAWLARPLVWFLTESSNLVLRPFGDRTTFTESRHSAEELQQLVEEASRAGTVDARAGEIASRALAFADLTARDVMIPRREVVMIPRDAPNDEIRRILLEHTHRRLPVYEGSPDRVVGYVSVRDIIHLVWQGQLCVLEDVMRPAWFVPESMPAVKLLEEMQLKRIPFAIVVDELGGTSGIVTTEDLVEELVGELMSEHGVGGAAAIIRESADEALVAANTPIRDVNRELGLALPEEGDYTTLAGLAIVHASRIPARGEVLVLPDGTRLEIVDASPRRIRSIRIRRAPTHVQQA